MWLPKLEYDTFTERSEFSQTYRDFIDKNLPLHRAPIIESLCLRFFSGSLKPEDVKSWAGIAVSRCVRELSISYSHFYKEPDLLLPSSLYTCKSLVTLKLEGYKILVDVPPTVSLFSLKTLRLGCVTYSNDDSLRLLLSDCPVLEDLFIDREGDDNMRKLVIIVPSLQRLTLVIDQDCSDEGYVMVTPSLKYFKVDDYRSESACLIEHMPELKEAEITVMGDIEKDTESLLKSITTVKRLTLRVRETVVYPDGIFFSQLENLKVYICSKNWSKLLVHLLKGSPHLRILDLEADKNYKQVSWSKNQGSVPKYFLNSLETFKFKGYNSKDQEDRDFMSLIFKHARCLKSTSILHG